MVPFFVFWIDSLSSLWLFWCCFLSLLLLPSYIKVLLYNNSYGLYFPSPCVWGVLVVIDSSSSSLLRLLLFLLAGILTLSSSLLAALVSFAWLRCHFSFPFNSILFDFLEIYFIVLIFWLVWLFIVSLVLSFFTFSAAISCFILSLIRGTNCFNYSRLSNSTAFFFCLYFYTEGRQFAIIRSMLFALNQLWTRSPLSFAFVIFTSFEKNIIYYNLWIILFWVAILILSW